MSRDSMSRQDVENRCRAQLSELDRLTALLGEDLGRLGSALPPERSGLERLRTAYRCGAELRRTLEEAARQADLRLPEWTDRAALGSALDGFFAAWTEAEAVRPRAALKILASALDAGQFGHRLPSKRNRLESIRLRAAAELHQAATGSSPPPALPGLEYADGWLSWAWHQDGDALERLVQGLQPSFPALAELLTEGELDWWQKGPPAEHVAGNGATNGKHPPTNGTPHPAPANGAGTHPAPPVSPSTGRSGLGQRPGEIPGDKRKPARPAALIRLPAQVRAPTPPRVVVPPPPPVPETLAVVPAVRAEAPVAPSPPPLPLPRPAPRRDAARPAAPRPISGPRVIVLPAPPPPASDPRTPPGPMPEIAPEVLSFAAFAARNWIAPSGRCEVVPWLAEDFGDRLDAAQQEALVRLARGEAQVLGPLDVWASAAERLRRPSLLTPSTVAALAALWAEPQSPTAGRDRARAAWLRALLLGLAEGNPVALRLGTFLEALRPTAEEPLTPEEAEELLGAVSFRDKTLARVVRDLLRLGTHRIDPVGRLRTALAATSETLDDCRDDLERRRETLHKEVLRLGRAAGSSYVGMFAHCAQSWAAFLEEIRPQLKTFFPRALQGSADWDPDVVDAWIARVPAVHDRIADQNEAREKSRKIMDRAARTLTDHLTAVNEAQRRLHSLRDARPDKGAESVPADEVRRLQQGEPLAIPDEEVCRLLLLRLLNPPAVTSNEGKKGEDDPLVVTTEQLLAHPDLLGLLTEVPGSPTTRGEDNGEVPARWDGLTDPIRAAAVLLTPPNASGTDGEDPFDALARWLKRNKRFHLLGRLASRLPVDDQKLIHRKRDEAVDRLQGALASLHQVWPQLADLAAPQAAILARPLEEARRLASDAPASEGKKGEEQARAADPDLVLAWLEALRAETLRARDATIIALRYHLAAAGDERSQGLLRLLDEGRYGEVLSAPGERPAGPRGWRETRWRTEADQRYANPRGRLLALEDDLATAWTQPLSPATAARTLRALRTEFTRRVFGGEAVGSLYRRGEQAPLQPEAWVLPCRAVRDHLAAGLPTFLPQLADFTDLVVLTPLVAPADPSFGARALELVGQQSRGALCVVLAPGLTREVRADLLRDCRRRGAAAAVLDDLDLCRLLNPGGRQPAPVLSLVEIVLEQLTWTRLSPFRQPASHPAEMVVGRTEEADTLFRSARYTRLFSGRKVGKTTLLRHLEQTCDGRELPSRQTLHVLLVPIVGVQTETDLVNRLFEIAHRRLGFDPWGIGPRGEDPQAEGSTGAALVRYLLRYVEQRPTHSLLFLIDDADEFVRAQLDAYEEVGDDCLAVRLRKELGDIKDNTDLPRVRFVFSGYRATATYGGPWAHWGEVLHLEPLRPDAAAGLVAAPLARMGIDASAQADALAFRCGYQPAVLLRFGEELLRHLEARHGYQEGVTVTAEDVNATFHQRVVQDEIRQVVRNNFWGNPAGQAVFAAFLLELAALPPCQGLRNAADAILARLRALDPDTTWLANERTTGETSTTSDREQVAAQLSDLVRRHLVVERSDPDGGVHALPFPYHLSVLLANDPEGEIRTARQALESRAEQQGLADDTHRGLLPSPAMADLRQALALPDLRAVVIGSHWPRAVGHRTGGLPDRLGIDPNRVRPAATLRPPLLEAPQLAVVDAGPETLNVLLADRPPGLPAPLVTGGADLVREALDRSQRGEGLEVVGLRRLTRPVLRWWFERVRCLDFARPDDLDLLIRRTSGIPFLVRLLDEILVPSAFAGTGDNGDGFAHSHSARGPVDLDRALAVYAERLPGEVQLLVDGPPVLRLTPRELDLVRMLETIGAALGYSADLEPARSLGEEWSLLYADVWHDQWPGLPFPEPLTDGPSDQVAVQTLLLLGLVPGEGNHLAPLPPGDALTEIVLKTGSPPGARG